MDCASVCRSLDVETEDTWSDVFLNAHRRKWCCQESVFGDRAINMMDVKTLKSLQYSDRPFPGLMLPNSEN